jgi:hypothetical protein
MIIWNGNRKIDTDDPKTLPIGTLFSTAGGVIPVYRDNIAEAYAAAVGAPPAPPPLLDPGGLSPTYGKITVKDVLGIAEDLVVVTGYTYDPGPDNLNKALIDGYKAAVDAWNYHAQATQKIVDVIIQQLKQSS